MIYLVRHGESTANIGLPTENHKEIPLTEQGRLQAAAAAEKLAAYDIDFLVVSPFLRALETAEEYRKLRSEVKCFVDPRICEYTYLRPAKCKGLTNAQRRPLRQDYWQRNDPYYVDGEGAESFLEFLMRAKSFYDDCAGLKGKHLAVFSHSQMINILLMLDDQAFMEMDLVSKMSYFRNNMRWVENAEIIPMQL